MTIQEIMANAGLESDGQCVDGDIKCPDCYDVSGYVCDSRKFKRILNAIAQITDNEYYDKEAAIKRKMAVIKETPKTVAVDEREERIIAIMGEIVTEGIKRKIREISKDLSDNTSAERMISRIEDLHALKENLLKYKMEQTESCK
jgi:hypothetical protein